MKRVVFLCFIAMMWSNQTVSASSIETYTFTDYEIRLMYERNDQNRLGYMIQKVGLSPFVVDLYQENADLHVNQVIELEGNHLIYGYIHQDGTSSYYSGFFTVLSPTGEQLDFEVIDDGYEEDVRHVFVLDHVLMMVVLHLDDDGDGYYQFREYEVRIYAYDFTLLNTIMIPIEQTSFTASEGMLLINTDSSDAYEQAILEDGTRLKDDQLLPIETNQIYVKSVYIPFLNEAIINNQTYYNGVIIDYPGNYTLVYQGVTYSFTVDSSVSGVEDNQTYHEAVIPYVSSGQVYLNNDLFVSGTTIDQPGDYNLIIRGVNGYEKTIHFTITSNIVGVLDHQTYYDDITLSFTGIGYLNDTFITSPYVVENPGSYVFTIEGENNYQETYEFELLKPESELSFGSFLKQYDLIILGITVVSGFLILKKK